MHNRDNFENMRERATFRVPDDFFETITEKTLEKARKRKRRVQRRIFITWSSTAALVMVIIVFSILNTSIFLRPQEQKTVVRIEEYRESALPGSIWKPFLDSVSVVDEQIHNSSDRGSASTLSEGQHEESLESLLASLSEEELFELAEQLSAELLLNELIEEYDENIKNRFSCLSCTVFFRDFIGSDWSEVSADA